MTDKQREAFERAMNHRGYLFMWDGVDYDESTMQWAWEGWQAATTELESMQRERDELRALVERLAVHLRPTCHELWKDCQPYITRKLGETK